MNNTTRVEINEFKGNPIFNIKSGEFNVISFGKSKAKAILDHIDEIKEFVGEKND